MKFDPRKTVVIPPLHVDPEPTPTLPSARAPKLPAIVTQADTPHAVQSALLWMVYLAVEVLLVKVVLDLIARP